MSYILEALKKSEQARGHGAAPGIQTVHSSGLNYQTPARSIWPWLLIAAVLLNLIVLLYFVFNKNPVAPQPEPVASEQPAAVVAAPPQTAPQAVPVNAPVAQETVPAPEPEHVEHKPTAAEIFEAVDISELPEDIRHQIPEMTFSAHVFSSNPQQRSVVINGHFMEESESLDDGFVLKQITSTGVIMDFHGHLFRTSVISGW
jgi:general secretion pathway protein B